MKADLVLPATSLIICSRNRPTLLFETVESILQGTEVPNEIIIVDQSAVPHPKLAQTQTERTCDIRYIHSQVVGVGASRNTGINSSQFEILIFIDDDMYVESDWLRNLVQAVVNAGQCSVVTGQVLPGEMEAPGSKAPSLKKDQQPAVYRGRIGKDVLYTGNMGAYRSIFDHIGRFDERLGPGTLFPAAEDNDLGFRLLEQGYSICYTPEAIVYHRAWRSDRENLLLKWQYGVGRGAYYAKHMSWRDPYMLSLMLRDIKRSMMNFLGPILRQRRTRYEYLFSAVGICYGAVRWRINQIIRNRF